MEKVIDLKDLLKHELMDLYSAEEQIIEALPLMIEKAGNEKLKTALSEHLKITENQKARLDEVKQLLSESTPEENEESSEGPGFFSSLFGDEKEKCKGMEGLISEGQKMMSTDMSPQASDASIIASAQKIEHYEICGYGTARAFARELNLGEVAEKLEETLNEEYAADDILTDLAVGKINVEAEFAGSKSGKSSSRSSQAKSNSRSNTRTAPSKTAPSKNNRSTSAAKSNVKSAGKSSPSKSASKKSASKGGKSPAKGNSSNNQANKSAAKSKAAGKKSGAKATNTSAKKSSSKSKSRGR
jgi:ferritin-like metal-binding protein YciE